MTPVPYAWLESEDDALAFYSAKLVEAQMLVRSLVNARQELDACLLPAIEEAQERCAHWFQLAVGCAKIVGAA
jgi:hypothetical protein